MDLWFCGSWLTGTRDFWSQLEREGNIKVTRVCCFTWSTGVYYYCRNPTILLLCTPWTALPPYPIHNPRYNVQCNSSMLSWQCDHVSPGNTTLGEVKPGMDFIYKHRPPWREAIASGIIRPRRKRGNAKEIRQRQRSKVCKGKTSSRFLIVVVLRRSPFPGQQNSSTAFSNHGDRTHWQHSVANRVLWS